ncbi:MAG: degU4 [Actinomycetia bacterium]|nr:degU4 [Actinomycetes bacterium]
MRDVRVLLADDNADLREMLRLSLELAGGFEVVAEAGDAWAAVALAASVRPDVVLVDLLMPGRDQVDVIGEVRRANPEIGVVVLTGWVVEGERDRALADGASEYLIKAPDLMATLVPALRGAVPPRVVADAER